MTRPEARSFINIVLLQFREDLVSWLSFATLLTWMFGMYWSDTFANDPSGAQFGILHLRALWLATEAVALLVMLAASRPLLRHVRATAAVAGTLLFVGRCCSHSRQRWPPSKPQGCGGLCWQARDAGAFSP